MIVLLIMKSKVNMKKTCKYNSCYRKKLKKKIMFKKKRIKKRGFDLSSEKEFVKGLESVIMSSEKKINNKYDYEKYGSFESLLFKMQIEKRVYVSIIYKRVEEFMNIYSMIDKEVKLKDNFGTLLLYNIIFNIFIFVHFNNMMIRNNKNYSAILNEMKKYDNGKLVGTEILYPPIFLQYIETLQTSRKSEDYSYKKGKCQMKLEYAPILELYNMSIDNLTLLIKDIFNNAYKVAKKTNLNTKSLEIIKKKLEKSMDYDDIFIILGKLDISPINVTANMTMETESYITVLNNSINRCQFVMNLIIFSMMNFMILKMTYIHSYY